MTMPTYPESFMPGTSQNLAYTGASARVAMAANGPIVRVFNNGTSPVFIEFGDVTVVAVLDTGIGIPAGGVETFRLPDSTVSQASVTQYYIAAISAGTGNLNFQCGWGL